jgi:hypothetical protein
VVVVVASAVFVIVTAMSAVVIITGIFPSAISVITMVFIICSLLVLLLLL